MKVRGTRLTELVLLLEVHVDDTAGPDTCHLASVERANLCEFTGTGSVATVLSEEDRDVVLFEVLGLNIVTGLGEGRVTAPRVDVVAPEVNGAGGVAAVEVVGHVLADCSIVVGCVSNTNLTVILALDVGLGVTDSRLDEGTGDSVVGLVADLVTGEEAERVVVLHHLVNNASVAVVELDGPARVVTVDGQSRFRQVGYDVDSGVCELRHAVPVASIHVPILMSSPL